MVMSLRPFATILVRVMSVWRYIQCDHTRPCRICFRSLWRSCYFGHIQYLFTCYKF